MASERTLPQPLDRYRSYLQLLARSQLHPTVGARLEVSDVVQETLLEAHRDREHFRGETPEQLGAWLRQILARNLSNALRDLRRLRRDVARDRSLDAAIESSSVRLEGVLADPGASPSQAAARQEQVIAASEAVLALTDAQQEVLYLRFWQGASLAEIAEVTGKTAGAVAALLHRALGALRSGLCPEE